MWYLYALLFWHLTLPLLTLLRDKLRLPGAVLGLALAVGISLWGGTIDWPFTLVRVFAFYPFYAFGVLFRPQVDALDRLANRFWAVRVAPALLLLPGTGTGSGRCCSLRASWARAPRSSTMCRTAKGTPWPTARCFCWWAS